MAFFIALLLCIVTIFAGKGYYDNLANKAKGNNEVRYDVSFAKFKSHNVLVENIDDTTLTVMGSSELSRITKALQHPKNMVDFEDLKYMTIGQGYFQSILHTITLGSIEEGIKNRKVVLFLSPQWFVKDGILKEAFASRYSEDHIVHFLKNANISENTKQQVVKRVEELLEGNDALVKRVEQYQDAFVKKTGNVLERTYIKAFSAFLNEKYEYEYWMKHNVKKDRNERCFKDSHIDYQKLLDEGIKEAKKSSTNNQYGIRDDYWNKNIKKKYRELKDSHKNISYAKSKEYDDLQLFLQVAKELGITVELVNQPVNGTWYDYMGHSKEDRETYYQNIRDIASENGVRLLDLSTYEYEPYFFMDATHFGWKGWVIINEELIKFAQE